VLPCVPIGTVSIVDDDSSIRDSLAWMLGVLGHLTRAPLVRARERGDRAFVDFAREGGGERGHARHRAWAGGGEGDRSRGRELGRRPLGTRYAGERRPDASPARWRLPDGIGFTVALFIAELAFGESLLLAEAKIGILAGSLVAALVGGAVLALRAPAAEAA
jgi:hypothetical protein